MSEVQRWIFYVNYFKPEFWYYFFLNVNWWWLYVRIYALKNYITRGLGAIMPILGGRRCLDLLFKIMVGPVMNKFFGPNIDWVLLFNYMCILKKLHKRWKTKFNEV